MAEDASHYQRLASPSPHAQSVRLVALANGWAPECLDLCVDCGLAFLENIGTRLSHNSATYHSVSPNTCTTIGAPSSSMKSHMVKKTDAYITSCDS